MCENQNGHIDAECDIKSGLFIAGNLSIISYGKMGKLIVWPGSHRVMPFLLGLHGDPEATRSMATKLRGLPSADYPIMPQVVDVPANTHIIFCSSMIHAGYQNDTVEYHMRLFNYWDSIIFSPKSPADGTFLYPELFESGQFELFRRYISE